MKKSKKILLLIFSGIAIMLLTITVIASTLVEETNVEVLEETDSEAERGPEEKKETVKVILDIDEIPKKPNKDFELIFTESEITAEVLLRINGISFKENSNINIGDLRYVRVTYWGFDDELHYGELIVHNRISGELIDIFKELCDNKYPIEKIKLVDEYDGDDNLSMSDNNTHVFNYRKVTGTNTLSNHSYGLAVDINPIQNPYVKGSVILPPEGKEYLNRDNVRTGMIIKADICYNAFISRGWQWGGDWNSLKDYQHFEKIIKGIND